MYSRSYCDDKSIVIPDNYDGNAFADEAISKEARTPKIETGKNEVKFSPKNTKTDEEEPILASAEPKDKKLFGIDYTKILSGGFLKGLSLKSLIPSNIGFEELLILGVALFLLFSSSRDIECALLLIALVFIK